MFRLRYRLRTLLAAMLLLCVGLSLVNWWWTKPLVRTGSHPNGVRAWEQWQRRTLTRRYEHLKTIRYYSNGHKAMEYTAATNEDSFWDKQGRQIDRQEFYRLLIADGLHDVRDDPFDEDPFKPLIYWWNGW